MEMMEIQKRLQSILPPYRYYHSLGVSYTAAALAMCYKLDVKRAELTGLLHDSAKFMKGSEMLILAMEKGIEVSEYEKKAPDLLHAKLGAYFARTEYGIEDEEVLSAIRCHTTGKPEMTLLEEIVYVADYIEPSRKGLPHLDEMRSLAFKNLHQATYLELSSTLMKVESRKEVLDPKTKEAFLYYKNILEVKE